MICGCALSMKCVSECLYCICHINYVIFNIVLLLWISMWLAMFELCVYLLERLLWTFHVINAIMFIHVAMMYMCHAMYCEYCHTHIYALHW